MLLSFLPNWGIYQSVFISLLPFMSELKRCFFKYFFLKKERYFLSCYFSWYPMKPCSNQKGASGIPSLALKKSRTGGFSQGLWILPLDPPSCTWSQTLQRTLRVLHTLRLPKQKSSLMDLLGILFVRGILYMCARPVIDSAARTFSVPEILHYGSRLLPLQMSDIIPVIDSGI